jgi:hypothetical protein
VKVRVVGLSGPDGSGKSTLSQRLRAALERSGFQPSVVYVYGCPLCRRLPSDGWAQAGEVSRALRSGFPARMHALLDAAEMSLRLGFAWWRARLWTLVLRRGGAPGAVILTDRSPLDGLVKFGVSPSSWSARWFGWIAGRYEKILLLDSPAEVLALRDGQHSPNELERMRRTFGEWAPSLPNVERLDTSTGTTDELTAAALHATGWIVRDP